MSGRNSASKGGRNPELTPPPATGTEAKMAQKPRDTAILLADASDSGLPFRALASFLIFGFSWNHCLLYLLPQTNLDKRRAFPEVSNLVREITPPCVSVSYFELP